MHLSSAKPALLGIGKPSTATNSAAATARGEAMGWTNPPHHNIITTTRKRVSFYNQLEWISANLYSIQVDGVVAAFGSDGGHNEHCQQRLQEDGHDRRAAARPPAAHPTKEAVFGDTICLSTLNVTAMFFITPNLAAPACLTATTWPGAGRLGRLSALRETVA